MWTITNPNNIKGMTMWSTWTFRSVKPFMNSPPQNQYMSKFPKDGIVESMLLKTVNPQNDIWLSGRTYPKKVKTTRIRNIMKPLHQIQWEEFQCLHLWKKNYFCSNCYCYFENGKPTVIIRSLEIEFPDGWKAILTPTS